MRTVIQDLIVGEADPDLLARVRAELEPHSVYTLWLEGEMGAGKTAFVRAYLYGLGLSARNPVVSPTYTIMNEYKIGADWYAHLDLYRADARFSLDELGVRDVRSYKGTFVEWPVAGGETEVLPPTHILKITPEGADRRRYTLQALN